MAKVARRPRWATVAATAVFLSSFIQARATTVYTSEASSLQNMTRGKNPIELQIVRAVFKIKNTEVPFNRSRLNHVYHTYEAEKMQKADEELKNRGLFTIRYILIDGTNAVSPCRGHSKKNVFIKDSLLVAPSNLSQCSQVCTLKPTNSGQVTSVMYNVLFKTGPICSSDNGVAYQLVHLNNTKGTWTRVDDKGFQWTSTTNVQEVNVLLKLKNLTDITRLWFSLNAQSALPDIGQSNSSYNYTFFNMNCDPLDKDTKLPDCVNVTATTSAAPTLTVKYPQDSTTQQTESPIVTAMTGGDDTVIIMASANSAGLVFLGVSIVVIWYLKSRQTRRQNELYVDARSAAPTQAASNTASNTAPNTASNAASNTASNAASNTAQAARSRSVQGQEGNYDSVDYISMDLVHPCPPRDSDNSPNSDNSPIVSEEDYTNPYDRPAALYGNTGDVHIY